MGRRSQEQGDQELMQTVVMEEMGGRLIMAMGRTDLHPVVVVAAKLDLEVVEKPGPEQMDKLS